MRRRLHRRRRRLLQLVSLPGHDDLRHRQLLPQRGELVLVRLQPLERAHQRRS